MKTIIIDDKKIEISDESYEAFKKQFATKDKAILWKPEGNDVYFYIDDYGDICTRSWGGSGTEFRLRHELGNTFKTKEEAQEALDTGWVAKRKAEVKILRFIAENDLEFEPDWDNDDVNKYYVYYAHDNRNFQVTTSCRHQHSILPYFKSEEDAQKLIDAMTPELKILFGVK